jgi:hypothetical protein
MTNEMDLMQEKLTPELLASFNKRVTKLYLNFG